MAIQDGKQSLGKWAPLRRQQSADRISPQRLREQMIRAQDSQEARSLSKASQFLGTEANNLTDRPFQIYVRGLKAYCSYRHPRECRRRNIKIEGRECNCETPHEPTYAQDWRATPAEADWDYALPNGGYPRKVRKVAFAEEVSSETVEVERYLKRSSFKRSRDDTTAEDDDAELICINLEEAFGDVFGTGRIPENEIDEETTADGDFDEDEEHWLRSAPVNEVAPDKAYQGVVIDGLGTLDLGL